MTFKALEITRRQSATVTIDSDGNVYLPQRTSGDGRAYAPTKIGEIGGELGAALVVHVGHVYDELKARKAASDAAKAVAAEDEE